MNILTLAERSDSQNVSLALKISDSYFRSTVLAIEAGTAKYIAQHKADSNN